MVFMNNSTIIYANSSRDPYGTWNGAATIQTLFTIATLATNGVVLSLFICRPRLCTPFAMYLINLLTANILMTLANPLRTIELMRTDWFAWSRWCLVLIYSDWVSSAVVLHSHFLITTNRIWAIVLPISYRNVHNRKVAVGICAVMWLYCHVWLLPLFIRDFLYYGNFDSDRWCIINVNEQLVYSQVIQVVVFLLPYVAILIAYPFLYYRRRMQMRSVMHNQKSIPSSEEHSNKTPASTEQGQLTTKKPGRENSTGFTVLTVQTISVFICWTVTKVYGTVGTFMDIEIGWLGQLGTTMYLVQMVLDPILFTLALPDLRAAAVQLIKCAYYR
ncbi:melanopsin-A-like [Paramacrobiotus metropolitanus]|uniref:melanopsin-A-like n=1 Tax=Paramacrobiotus metropolitanus TaxID=2943436 RepID=UPI002445FB96|nr:melanopsin-A-like [Paramacrobiotus metropolitanus]